MDAHYLVARLGIANDEVAKTEALHDSVPQVHRQLLRVLVEKHTVEVLHAHAVLGLARLDDDGQVRVALA